ncbi:SPOR domain-containing protein [Thorsellia kenyensis]|uniref:SPOR domain-containing protein n=1 Tax=Thorsellia kenyensis TaxID=1549888 RepID=A0ABV6CAU5_9GAMM
MASKFQKQLVGTVILVGISVAILPSLFDGKKWNDDQYPKAIPLYTPTSTYLQNDESKNQGKQEVAIANYEAQNQLNNSITQQPIVPNQAVSPEETMQSVSNPPPDINQEPSIENLSNQLNNSNSTNSSPTDQATKNVATGKYIIQLATLSNHERAVELVEFLKTKQYNAFLLKTTTLTRVFIGPSDSKEALEIEIPNLKEMTGLDGKIVALK